jgi:hypothetical protein
MLVARFPCPRKAVGMALNSNEVRRSLALPYELREVVAPGISLGQRIDIG